MGKNCFLASMHRSAPNRTAHYELKGINMTIFQEDQMQKGIYESS